MKEPGYTWDNFTMIGGLAYAPMALVVNTASSKAKTLQELVDVRQGQPRRAEVRLVRIAERGEPRRAALRDAVRHRLA